MKTLVTGGVRSGKSQHAEQLLDQHPQVTYVVPGLAPHDDAEWAARVAAHQARRPQHWTTLETPDLAMAVIEAPGAVLVDCLGTWVTRLLDDAGAWPDREQATAIVEERTDSLVDALETTDGEFVLVTNEVGLGIVPEHASGRLFRDLVGVVNQRVAAVCQEVHLVVVGRVLHL
ncbi:bifunctional adenosylcobinamide kinase/adenosylcobinamide-phosphate guanylyltransferase [Nocardioides mangrovicus]|uniref:Adenosylcobinamide kinase n=1 Tax=Nocardioides mangrovicus TaxID=2478913 RepID=A0A3L8P617_9ACTN|nr:bifunctional adenosylcobinamide kinase/adenosylcobinamide-phosphate guanylyltransferase [Nocardioides mangrovicus]RLV50377.1 bifunctional adenosylcobinamide kinase/adenosylcobinamide-phosphate guanylyltransferase [Nocardioides mangrovicus]